MRLRLCLCTDSPDPSGVGEHMLALAAGLQEAWVITLAAPDVPGAAWLLQRAAAAGFAIRFLPASGQGVDFSDGHFDVLHIHAGIGWEGHNLALTARASSVPVVIRTEHLPYLLSNPVQQNAYVTGVARVDRLICVSGAVADSYREAGVDSRKVEIIRNGIVPGNQARPADETRHTLGIPADAPVILAVARLTVQKGHATLLMAIPTILAAHPNACFLLVGDGPEADRLKCIAKNVAPGGAVRFLGWRGDVPDLLAAADLLLLPSLFEGLPLVVLEAMAAGLPVVATRIGGTLEAVSDGMTGLLFDPGDSAGLANAVRTLLADPLAAKEAGQAGQRRFADEFHFTRMAAETHRLYAETLTRAGTFNRRVHAPCAPASVSSAQAE
jgi:glycosyltransferase involved in cell wall biosynthesis